MPDQNKIAALGKRIFQRMNDAGPRVISKDYWEQQLMELSMANEAFKVRMFHFVDVYPTLKGSHEVARHFHEYFPTLEGVPTLFKMAMAGAKLGAAIPLLSKAADMAVSGAADVGIRQMAKKFITADSAKNAVAAVEKLHAMGIGFTMDVLGEATVCEEEAEQYCAIYMELIPALAARAEAWAHQALADGEGEFAAPRVNLSVKLSSMYSQMSPLAPEACVAALKARLRPIMRLAMQHGVALNVDQEQYAYKDIIQRTFIELMDEAEFAGYAYGGIVVQAYLRESEHDTRTLIEWARGRRHPIHIRLVKGAYWDYETVIAGQKHLAPPVWTRKWQSDANYEKLSGLLLQNYRHTRPAFASHNVRSLAAALALAEELGVPRGAYEVQVLFGMGDSIATAVTREGCRCRVYAPYGDMIPGMGYLVRRLLENTSNDSFLLQTMNKSRNEDALLQAPNGPPEDVPGTASDRFVNTPEVDWAQASERDKMRAAIAEVRGQLGRSYALIINGKPVTTATQRDSVNPSQSSEVIGRVAQAGPEHAEQALAAARAAFPAWRDTHYTMRADLLMRCAEITLRRKFELAAWMVLEAGKTWNEAIADVEETVDYCRYYAWEMRRLGPPRLVGHVPGETNHYLYEGKGVGIIIAPWNFPLAIMAGMSLASVVTGNTVIIKPSNFTPVIAAKFMEILAEAGMPAGVANYLPGPGSAIGDLLVRSPETNFVAFTGSQEVGLHICRAAAETPGPRQGPKRVIAEMGGKNALIIDSDADLDEAVTGALRSAFGYAGQKCSACSRVIVLEAVYDTFCRRLRGAAEAMIVGPADDPHTLVNPVIDGSARDSINRYIEIGTQEATLLMQRELGTLASQGFYVAPTVFCDVAPEARIAQEEIFGPVLAVIKARDMDHALEIANGTAYALTGGIFSRSPKTIERVRREFHTGNLYINRSITGAIVERQPFGGFKMSGIGSKAGGPDYLLQFVNPRTITENTLRRGFAPKAEGTSPAS